MYKPPFDITNKMLNLCISITEKIGRITSFNSLKKMPILRKMGIDKSLFYCYNTWAVEGLSYGGIAQLARASGSYPAGRWFKSDFRYQYPFCNGPLVKRLRHRPFTAVTGVRFSYGSPKNIRT